MRISRPIAYIVLYVALYAAFGVASPFWPKFFETRALNAQQIGLILGAAMLVRLAAGPLLGMLADLLGSLRLLLATCVALAAGTAAAFLLANTFWLLFLRPGLHFSDGPKQSARSLNGLISNLSDHVADLDPGVVRGAARLHRGNKCALGIGPAQRLGDPGRQFLQANADVAPLDLTRSDELIRDRLRGPRRHRKSDAYVGAYRRKDRRIDADHLARGVEQRASRVALVDRGICLQKIVI